MFEEMIQDHDSEIQRTVVFLMTQDREKRGERVEGPIDLDKDGFSAVHVLTNRVFQLGQVKRKLNESCNGSERFMFSQVDNQSGE